MSTRVERPDDKDKVPEEGLWGDSVSRRQFLLKCAAGCATLTAVGVGGAVLSACGSSATTTTTGAAPATSTTGAAGATTTTAAAAASKTLNDLFGPAGPALGQGINWKHGLNTAVTGASAELGKYQTWGCQLAAKMITEAGGPTMTVLLSDHKSGDVTASVNGVTRLVKQEGIQSLSTSWGGATISLFPLLKQNQILTMWSGGAGPQVLDQDYVWSTMAFFAVGPATGGLAWLAKQFPQAKKLSLIGQQENGLAATETIAPTIWPQVSSGGTIVSKDYINLGTTDFSSTVARLKAANPDVIFSTIYGSDEGYMIKQVRQAGIKAPMLHIDMTTPTVPELAGDTLGEDNYLAVDAYVVDNPNPFNQIYVEAFRKEHGTDPDYFSANQYEGTMVIWESIIRILANGGTADKGPALQDAVLLPKPDHYTVYGGNANEIGVMKFQKDHSMDKPMGVFKLGVTPSMTGIVEKLATIRYNSTEVLPA